jgi:small multidrug resistance pump
MTGWALLAAAILCEVSATLVLKRAVDHPALYALVAVGYVSSFVLLARTLGQGLGIGLVYAVWAGCGVALVALGSRALFHEPLNGVMLVGISLIIGGVALVELGASH